MDLVSGLKYLWCELLHAKYDWQWNHEMTYAVCSVCGVEIRKERNPTMPFQRVIKYDMSPAALDVKLYTSEEMAEALNMSHDEFLQRLKNGLKNRLCYHFAERNNAGELRYLFNQGAYDSNLQNWQADQTPRERAEYAIEEILIMCRRLFSESKSKADATHIIEGEIERAILREREACAQVADEVRHRELEKWNGSGPAYHTIAEEIRDAFKEREGKP
jgi:hypothetical protein